MPDIVTAYESFNARNQTPGATDTFTRAPVIGNAQSTIDLNSSSGGIKVFQFPTDSPPNHFVIIECEFSNIGGVSFPGLWSSLTNFNKVYRLPLPMNLNNEFQVMFDADFNWLELFGGNRGILARGAQAIGAAAGLAVNNFRTVTLSVPRFRRIPLEFRLYPKTRDESDMITKIIHGLNTGMHPKKLNKVVFAFPKVYLLQFNAGPQYLYKFKPCVLERIQVDYTGGAGVPAFYKDEKPIPQGYVVRTTWLELEYWTKENFDSDTTDNGLPSNNPGAGIATELVDNPPINITAPL